MADSIQLSAMSFCLLFSQSFCPAAPWLIRSAGNHTLRRNSRHPRHIKAAQIIRHRVDGTPVFSEKVVSSY